MISATQVVPKDSSQMIRFVSANPVPMTAIPVTKTGPAFPAIYPTIESSASPKDANRSMDTSTWVFRWPWPVPLDAWPAPPSQSALLASQTSSSSSMSSAIQPVLPATSRTSRPLPVKRAPLTVTPAIVADSACHATRPPTSEHSAM